MPPGQQLRGASVNRKCRQAQLTGNAMYNSDQLLKSHESAQLFAQLYPRYTCRNEYENLKKSLWLGYLFKCRNPRCSLECRDNWASKHSACLARHLGTLCEVSELESKSLTLYRGHLRMPPGAPADHVRTREMFLQTLRRWRKSHGYTLEINAVLDITSPTEAHWDVVAYSDAPKKPLRAIVSDAWSRAGGLRQSLVELDDDELAAQAKYQAKNLRPESPVGIKVDRRRRYLPAIQSDSGLNHHWSTGGFWAGRTVDSIWKELIAEWFGTDDQGDEEDAITRALSNSKYTTLPSTTTVNQPPEVTRLLGGKEAEFIKDVERRLWLFENDWSYMSSRSRCRRDD